jgi:FixJ family two-component response regulator
VALARQAFKAQASDFLEKPFDHDKLLAAIEEAFSREAHARGQLLRQVEGRPAARPDAA